MVNYEEKLKELLFLTEADVVSGDKRYSDGKEESDKKAKLTDKEKKDNVENVDEQKKIDNDKPSQSPNEEKVENIDKTLRDIDELEKSKQITKDDEIIGVEEKHKRVKMLDQFKTMLIQSENMISVLDSIVLEDISKEENAIFEEIYDSLYNLNKKLEYFISNSFLDSKYEKIIYLYTHLRSELLLITKIVRKVLHVRDKDLEEDKNKK